MSDISPRDGQDFQRPASVNGSSKSDLYVASNPDHNTTNRKVNGNGTTQGGSSNSNNSQQQGSNNRSQNFGNNNQQGQSNNQQQGNNNQQGDNQNGNALSRFFNLHAIFNNKAS